MSPNDEKACLRIEARAIRRAAFEAAGTDYAQRIGGHGVDFLSPLDGHVVAGYMAQGSEVDIGPLMTALADRGATLALPVVTGADAALTFRVWTPGVTLIDGAYGIGVPDTTAPEVRPDIVLTPLLAFDDKGHRLGQGGGFYDRTLESLRHNGDVRAVGIGFSAQRVPAIPLDDHDQRLDAVITEDGVIRVAP